MDCCCGWLADDSVQCCRADLFRARFVFSRFGPGYKERYTAKRVWEVATEVSNPFGKRQHVVASSRFVVSSVRYHSLQVPDRSVGSIASAA